jgi:hypothetical protein
MKSALGLCVVLVCACTTRDRQEPAPNAAQPATPSSVRTATSSEGEAAFANVVTALEAERVELAALYQKADEPERARLRGHAKKRVVEAIVHEIFPRWHGTPWDFHGTASRPSEGPVACGYFVAAVLENAGLRLSRRHYGQAAALRIQRALTPAEEDLERIFSVPADELESRIRALGDGLYLIGLDIHIGFVVVDGDEVRLVHASYTDDRVVIDEPLVAAEAIARSRTAGYFVTPLFRDDQLIDRWLRGESLEPPDPG